MGAFVSYQSICFSMPRRCREPLPRPWRYYSLRRTKSLFLSDLLFLVFTCIFTPVYCYQTCNHFLLFLPQVIFSSVDPHPMLCTKVECFLLQPLKHLPLTSLAWRDSAPKNSSLVITYLPFSCTHVVLQMYIYSGPAWLKCFSCLDETKQILSIWSLVTIHYQCLLEV